MKRKIVALLVLCALVALIVVGQASPTYSSYARVTAASVHGGWGISVGMSRSEAVVYLLASTAACATISGPGGIACGVVAGL